MTGEPADAGKPPTGEAGKLKVFISYSRTEVGFADELEYFLRNSQFEPLIDRHGIDAGEDWKQRLGDLILACDTVVFVLSDTSAQSSICKWEVEEAARLNKRMLVVSLGPTSPGVAPPVQLSGINWISCWANPANPGSNQTKGFFDLAQALRTNLGWLRAQTALQEQAVRWRARGGGGRSDYDAASSSLLLRGNVLAEALDWASAAPKDAAIPTDVSAFLTASEAHEAKLKAEAQAGIAEREAALKQAASANRRVRTATFVGAGVAALLLVLAFVAGGLAMRGFDEVARQEAQIAGIRSDLVARESEAIFDTGVMETSLLMALYADPSGGAPGIDRKYAAKDGYAFARARMAAAHENNRLKQLLEGHQGGVLSAAFSADGKWIVTGSWDNTARIWDAATGAPARTLEGHQGRVLSAAFSADGKWIVTGSDDTTARIWDVPEIIRAEPKRQVEIACETLAAISAPLAFSVADIAKYPVLQGQPIDPEDPAMLASPCRGVLPDEAFRKAAG